MLVRLISHSRYRTAKRREMMQLQHTDIREWCLLLRYIGLHHTLYTELYYFYFIIMVSKYAAAAWSPFFCYTSTLPTGIRNTFIPLMPTVAIWVQYSMLCQTGLNRMSSVIFDIRALWRSTLTLSRERQSVRMSKITHDGLTRSGITCFIAVPMATVLAVKGLYRRRSIYHCNRLRYTFQLF